MKRWLHGSVVAVVLAAVGGSRCAASRRRREQPTRPPRRRAPLALDLGAGDVLVVRRGELVRTLEISGGLKAYESAIVKARVAAEVKQITVREGDSVKAGQLLGRLDTTEYDWRAAPGRAAGRVGARRSSTSPSAR